MNPPDCSNVTMGMGMLNTSSSTPALVETYTVTQFDTAVLDSCNWTAGNMTVSTGQYPAYSFEARLAAAASFMFMMVGLAAFMAAEFFV